MELYNPYAHQGLGVPITRQTATAAPSGSVNTNRSMLLQLPVFMSDQQGTLDTLSVGGVDLLWSTVGFDLDAFKETSQARRSRHMSVPIPSSRPVAWAATLGAAGWFSGFIFGDPITGPAGLSPTNPFVFYGFGLGSSLAVAAAANFTLSGTANKPMFLGRLGLTQSGVSKGDVSVNGVTVAGDPLFNVQGTVNSVIDCFSWVQPDDDCFQVAQWVSPSDVVSVTGTNNHGTNPADIYGGIFGVPAPLVPAALAQSQG